MLKTLKLKVPKNNEEFRASARKKVKDKKTLTIAKPKGKVGRPSKKSYYLNLISMYENKRGRRKKGVAEELKKARKYLAKAS